MTKKVQRKKVEASKGSPFVLRGVSTLLVMLQVSLGLWSAFAENKSAAKIEFELAGMIVFTITLALLLITPVKVGGATLVFVLVLILAELYFHSAVLLVLCLAAAFATFCGYVQIAPWMPRWLDTLRNYIANDNGETVEAYSK